MIYRIHISDGATTTGPLQPPTAASPDRWFVAQIESRYNSVAADSLPVEWTDVILKIRKAHD
jgi:hypothetical protein